MKEVRGTIQFVSNKNCKAGEVRICDRLCIVENTEENKDRDVRELLNQDYLMVRQNAKDESYLAETAEVCNHYQFQRIGYITVDPDSSKDNLVFNRTISLKDSWSKEPKK